MGGKGAVGCDAGRKAEKKKKVLESRDGPVVGVRGTTKLASEVPLCEGNWDGLARGWWLLSSGSI